MFAASSRACAGRRCQASLKHQLHEELPAYFLAVQPWHRTDLPQTERLPVKRLLGLLRMQASWRASPAASPRSRPSSQTVAGKPIDNARGAAAMRSAAFNLVGEGWPLTAVRSGRSGRRESMDAGARQSRAILGAALQRGGSWGASMCGRTPARRSPATGNTSVTPGAAVNRRYARHYRRPLGLPRLHPNGRSARKGSHMSIVSIGTPIRCYTGDRRSPSPLESRG
jgi:hypothetical protein